MPAGQDVVDGRQVVIDAGAVIKRVELHRLGGELITTSGVYAEIRDAHARGKLQLLPQELQTRAPHPQALAFTKAFAKETGDLGFLSHNDVELIALTVTLHREAGGAPLRARPAALAKCEEQATFEWLPGQGIAPKGDRDAVQPAPTKAEAPAAAPEGGVEADAAAKEPADENPAVSAPTEGPPAEAAVETDDVGTVDTVDTATPLAAALAAEVTVDEGAQQEDDAEEDFVCVTGRKAARAAARAAEQAAAAEALQREADDGVEDVDSEDGDSAGEWVTEENMKNFGLGLKLDADVKVTCATSDYSVQNVLLQMGITPLTFDGFAVRSVKLWGKTCRACFFFTRETEKLFCPKCGKDALVRVPIVVDKDGKPQLLDHGRPLRRKGTIFSVPTHHGGRAFRPIFAEDELKIGGRDREIRYSQKLAEKERMSRDPFDPNFGTREWHQRGTTSTGKALLGRGARVQVGYGRVNPNANNHKFQNSRKKR